MMMGQSEALLDELASRARISDILLLYCRALDRCDVELMKSLYWEDAVDNHGVFNGGAAAFAEYIVGDTKQRFESTVPALGNMPIEVEGDVAHSESYLIANCVLTRSEEHTSELPSLMRISYAVFCLKKITRYTNHP